MQVVRRATYTFLLAAFLPLLVFAALQISGTLSRQREQVENESLLRARNAIAQVDAMLLGDEGALSVLASSHFIAEQDWAGASGRAQAVMNTRALWLNVAMAQSESGDYVWQTGPIETDPPRDALAVASTNQARAYFTDLVGGRPKCPCIFVVKAVESNSPTDQLVIVQRRVGDFQNILLKSVSGAEVAAIVDRKGSFIARTIDYEARLGTPATTYVRAAAAAGGEGVYSGTTYEGLENRTAYATSNLSGWSAHIAVPAQRFSLLEMGSIGFAIFGGLLALALAAGLAWIGVRDLANRRRAEQSRFRSQKLEAIGQVASGIAHDFNNLLAIISAVHARLKSRLSDPKDQELLDHGMSATKKGADLVRQILDFSRTSSLDVTTVDVGDCVRAIQGLLEQSLGANIPLTLDLQENARLVRTNRPQLELALLNLAVNARDAMPDGGKLEIISRSSRTPGCVDLIVRDNGPGMKEDVAAKATDPYFTTKPAGKGTGLGLAQVHALAIQSGGALDIETGRGKGTAIILRLPAVEGLSAAES